MIFTTELQAHRSHLIEGSLSALGFIRSSSRIFRAGSVACSFLKFWVYTLYLGGAVICRSLEESRGISEFVAQNGGLWETRAVLLTLTRNNTCTRVGG